MALEIKTYTNVWNTKKYIYSIWDWKLPQPIPLTAVLIFLVAGGAWLPIMLMFGVPFLNPIGLVLYLSVPVLAALLGDKPLFEGKSIIQYASTTFTYLSQPKVWTALRNDKDPRDEKVRLYGSAWLPAHMKKRKEQKKSPSKGVVLARKK